MRIFLTGFMGAGKSTVGGELAARLGWPFLDLDAEVEARTGATVAGIFAAHGEAEFRRLERAALAAALAGPEPAVVAVGGGTFADPAVLEAARARGFVVFLNPSFQTIVGRIGARGKTDRPLFRDEAAALALYRERLAGYRRADLVIDVGADEQPREIVERIRLRLPERVCST
jgi:shikimate kinase